MTPPTDGPLQTRRVDHQVGPTSRSPDRLHPVARVALGVTAPALGLLTVYLWFMGVITFTGCFIACGTPEPVLGSGLLLAAIASATGSITAAWLALSGSMRFARHVAAGTAILAGGVALLSVVT